MFTKKEKVKKRCVKTRGIIRYYYTTDYAKIKVLFLRNFIGFFVDFYVEKINNFVDFL